MLISLALAACATAVTFTVEHPPLVDLRNVNSITVIPFEWNAIREYESLSKHVTSVLISGVNRGEISFVDPYLSRNTHGLNYRNYADVYITGKIINVISENQSETREERNYRNETIKRHFIANTVTVVVEYTYIRSADKKILGNFSKTGMGSFTFERFPRQFDGSVSGRSDRRNNRISGAPRQSPPWTETAAVSAINNFADTMRQELNSWTATEKRRIKGQPGKDTQIAEANKLVRQRYYDEALDIYNKKYEQTGNISAGYNAAVLLEATDNFTKALELLEGLYSGILKTGKKGPSFITKEIQKVKGFINGFNILESYKQKDVINKSLSGNRPLLPSELSGGFSKAEDNRIVTETDSRGRLLSQTMLDANDKTVWTVKNTWVEDRITAVARIEGKDLKLTEFEYDGMGNKIVQREMHNGILERLVLIEGANETEELYMNGVLILRAHWKNGVKVSEERIRQR